MQRKLIKENSSLPSHLTIKSPTFSSLIPFFIFPYEKVLKAFLAQMEKEIHKKKIEEMKGKCCGKLSGLYVREVFNSQGKYFKQKLLSKALEYSVGGISLGKRLFMEVFPSIFHHC